MIRHDFRSRDRIGTTLLNLFLTFLDRISRHSQGEEGFGGVRISSLLFADDVVLFASSGGNLQLSQELFTTKGEVVWMRISSSKSQTMGLKRVDEVLSQVEELKYLGVLFMSGGNMEQKIGRPMQ